MTDADAQFTEWAWLIPCAALAAAGAGAAGWAWMRARRLQRLLRGLPCFPALPLVGNAHQILGDSKFILKMLDKMSSIAEKAGKPFLVWVGPAPAVLVQEPEDIKTVTFAFVEKPYYYGFARDWVGNGLVTAPGHIWKHNIKKLSGAFTGNIVEGYQQVFSSQAQKLVNQLTEEVGRAPFDVLHKYLALTTLETICQTALGLPEISENIVTNEYYQAFTRTFQLIMKRGMNILLHLDWVYKLTPSYKEFHKCIGIMQKMSNSIIAKKLKDREQKQSNGTLPKSDLENSTTRFKPFLEILLELRDLDSSIDMSWVQNEVDTIIVGGQETTATTLLFTLIVIGTKKDIQDKIYDEIKQIFGDSKRPVQKEDLVRMTYTEAVIFETLRLYPPIPFIMREADRDLEMDSWTIPKGAAVGINAWGAGRSSRAWGADAAEYRPERWGADLMRARAASFLAFSYGKRACIGRRYALALIKTILAYLVRELEVTSHLEQLEMKVECTLKADRGHLITVRRRV